MVAITAPVAAFTTCHDGPSSCGTYRIFPSGEIGTASAVTVRIRRKVRILILTSDLIISPCGAGFSLRRASARPATASSLQHQRRIERRAGRLQLTMIFITAEQVYCNIHETN